MENTGETPQKNRIPPKIPIIHDVLLGIMEQKCRAPYCIYHPNHEPAADEHEHEAQYLADFVEDLRPDLGTQKKNF